MSKVETLRIDEIDLGQRLRKVGEAHAQAIAASIVARGLINRISIRQTPNGAKKWALVAGAHRLRALAIADVEELRRDEHFTIVQADANEARLIEAEENLARNDLTYLDRAMTVSAYREAWTAKYGTIEPGNPYWGKLAPIDGEQISTFSEWAAERLGVSKDALKRLNRISQGIRSELRSRLEGDPASDNQSLLLRLAKMPPADQAKLVRAIAICDGDLDQALATIDPTAVVKSSKDDKICSRLVSTWGRTNPRVRVRFVDALKPDEQRDLFEILKTRLGE